MFVVMSLLMGLLAPGQAQTLNGAGPSAHDPHVRPLEKEARRLIERGLARSPTFQRLVARLEHSDVIVYVDVRWDLPLRLGGRLQFLASHPSGRYVLVQLNRLLARNAQVALLGHELQHAVEVADDQHVASSEGLRLLYRRVGVQTGPDTYDSIGARQAGYDVMREQAGEQGHDLDRASAGEFGSSAGADD